jgi:hypothetical protein
MRTFAAIMAVLFTLAVAQPAEAQTRIGFRAGATISNLSIDDAEGGFDPDSRTGFMAGAFLEMPLSGNISFQPGASYVRKGAEESEAGTTVGIELSYFEIPLLLKYGFPSSGPVGVHLYGGPALAFEASCKVKVEGGSFEGSVDCDEGGDPDDEVLTKSFDMGAMLGGGLSFGMGGATALVDVFYNLGLVNISDQGEGTAKNRAIYLTAGLSFPVGN